MQNTDLTPAAYAAGTWKQVFRLGRRAEEARAWYCAARRTAAARAVVDVVDLFVLEWRAAVSLALSLPWESADV